MADKEKAKAYEVALEAARKELNVDRKELPVLERVLGNIFPELAESEDERIGNVIYCIVRDNKEVKRILEGNGISVDNALAWLERQKENPKNDISIPSDCTSDVKFDDRWHKVGDSLPNNGRLVLANDCLGNTLLARYDGEGNWEVSVYDDADYYCRNTITKWCEIPLDKQKEQEPGEVDESTKILNDNWMKQHFDDYEEQKPAEWSEEDEEKKEKPLPTLF